MWSWCVARAPINMSLGLREDWGETGGPCQVIRGQSSDKWVQGARCEVWGHPAIPAPPPGWPQDLVMPGGFLPPQSVRQQYYYESFIISCGLTQCQHPLLAWPSRYLLHSHSVNCLKKCWRGFVAIITINCGLKGDCGYYFLQSKQFVIMMLSKRIVSRMIF